MDVQRWVAAEHARRRLAVFERGDAQVRCQGDLGPRAGWPHGIEGGLEAVHVFPGTQRHARLRPESVCGANTLGEETVSHIYDGANTAR